MTSRELQEIDRLRQKRDRSPAEEYRYLVLRHKAADELPRDIPPQVENHE